MTSANCLKSNRLPAETHFHIAPLQQSTSGKNFLCSHTNMATASIAAHRSCLHTLYRQLLLRSSTPCTAIVSPPHTVDFQLVVQKSRRELAHARNFLFKIPANVRACADSRRDFWTTNWKSTVATCTARCTPAWSKTPGHGLPSHHLLLTVHWYFL